MKVRRNNNVKLQKALPIILGGTTILGVVATAVLSARGGYKSAPMIEEHKEAMNQLRANKNSMDKKDYNKMVFEEFKTIGKACVKAYGWAVLSGTLTVAEIIFSNKYLSDLQKKYMGVVSLYTVLNAAFAEYRQRVIDEVGKEKEFEIHTGIKKEEIVDTVIDKKGNEKTKVTTVLNHGPYSNPDFIVFDKTSSHFREGNPEMNIVYLRSLQKDLNIFLKSRGRLYKNELYDQIESTEYPETEEGQIAGWIYDDTDPLCDCAVDFGIFDKDYNLLETDNVKNFMSGKNDFIYLSLNHDGPIYERFPQLIANRIGNHARSL